MAAIVWRTQGVTHKCAGSLIHPSVVLTVAHCVHNTPVERLLVRVGGGGTNDFPDFPHSQHRLRQVIVHERFNASRYSMHNDIALLFLDTPVAVSSVSGGPRTICLPATIQAARRQNQVSRGRSSTTTTTIFDNHRCVVSGWKAPVSRHQNHRGAAHILNKIQVPMVPRKICERALQSTRLGRRFRLHRSFICAGGEPGRDACTGDGGSPLVCVARNDGAPVVVGGQVRYVQTGIVALGIGCGNHVPAVYVNVAEFRQWIDDQMLTNGYARRFYQL